MPDTRHKAFDNLDFIAKLSHDLKTPVEAQVRATNLLYSGIFGEFSPEAKNILLNIIASNKYMYGLLNNVLGQYRMNGGNFVLNKTENDFRKTLEEALCNIGILSEVKGQKVVVNYNCKNYIKKYDEIEIQRVIINLLTNAFEYGKENTPVTITVMSKGGKLLFTVESSSFVNCAKTSQHSTPSLKEHFGLGLLICEQIMALHGGNFFREKSQEGVYSAGFVIP